MTQAASLEERQEEAGETWEGVDVIVVNLAPYDSALDKLVAATDLPVLQDSDEVDMGGSWGSSKSYVYVLDALGHPRYIHYTLDFQREEERLYDEVAALMAEEGR